MTSVDERTGPHTALCSPISDDHPKGVEKRLYHAFHPTNILRLPQTPQGVYSQDEYVQAIINAGVYALSNGSNGLSPGIGYEQANSSAAPPDASGCFIYSPMLFCFNLPHLHMSCGSLYVMMRYRLPFIKTSIYERHEDHCGMIVKLRLT